MCLKAVQVVLVIRYILITGVGGGRREWERKGK